MLKKDFKKQLKKIVKNYFENRYSSEINVFDELTVKFSNKKLTEEQKVQLKKFMLLFF